MRKISLLLAVHPCMTLYNRVLIYMDVFGHISVHFVQGCASTKSSPGESIEQGVFRDPSGCLNLQKGDEDIFLLSEVTTK